MNFTDAVRRLIFCLKVSSNTSGQAKFPITVVYLLNAAVAFSFFRGGQSIFLHTQTGIWHFENESLMEGEYTRLHVYTALLLDPVSMYFAGINKNILQKSTDKVLVLQILLKNGIAQICPVLLTALHQGPLQKWRKSHRAKVGCK